MTANDWERPAAHLADDCVVDWPSSAERFYRDQFAEVQARYPPPGLSAARLCPRYGSFLRNHLDHESRVG